MKVCPSNSADDAFPNDESDSEPETSRIRSGSMIPFALWVSCKGTIANCDTFVAPWRVDPSEVHEAPFQKYKNDEVPSKDLEDMLEFTTHEKVGQHTVLQRICCWRSSY